MAIFCGMGRLLGMVVRQQRHGLVAPRIRQRARCRANPVFDSCWRLSDMGFRLFLL
jgi:hypothetical protein